MRPWEQQDQEVLYKLAKDPHVGPPCGWTPHHDREESGEILKNLLMNDYTYAIVLKESGKVVGNIALMPYGKSKYAENDQQAEIGFWLGYPYWGNGYMPEACNRLIEYGFMKLKYKELLCAHDILNHNSKVVQDKCGFTYLRTDTFFSERWNKEITDIVNHRYNESEV